METRANQPIPTPEFDLIKQLLNQIEEIISQYSVTLTDAERTSFKGLSVDNLVFAKEAYQEAENNGQGILPAYIMVEDQKKDLLLFEQFDEFQSLMNTALRIVQDGRRIAGHKCVTRGNQIYAAFEAANNAGVVRAKTSYERLSERYRQNNSGGRPMAEDIP
jgi:hypothetical protein